mmetsp:Transcript_30917/g.74668  ORF Transcript_30917/g.74668 Transcript_30917/m.74668 type:complete len:573 (+) Transcript_30917:1-1719(+)
MLRAGFLSTRSCEKLLHHQPTTPPTPGRIHTTKMPPQKEDEPYGHCLLARDTPENRKLFPNGPFGKEAIVDTICPTAGQCPFYNYLDDKPTTQLAKDVPIHILIASFRDKLCARTLHNAFTHAKNPDRLFIRVIEQTKSGSDLEDDSGCFDLYCGKYNKNCQERKHQVRIVPVDASSSKGPTWARSRLSAMVHWDYKHRSAPTELDFQPVHTQDFCMQIDSHMDFSDDFDDGLVDQFHQTENDYAVLSTYVTDIEFNNKDPKNVPNLCMVTFTSSIRNWGTKECVNLVKPKLTNAMWGAGLSFHRCHAELNVPVDPYLDNVFDGEEGSRGIRFFTHGYDVYTPSKVLVTHDYHGHQGNPVVHTWGHGSAGKQVVHESNFKWFDEIEKYRPRLSIFGSTRVNLLIGIGTKSPNLEQESKDEIDVMRKSLYGVGTRRTLEQAAEFTGINLKERKMDVNRCGNLEWVPFQELPNYGLAETLSRGYAGEDAPPFVVTPDVRGGLSLSKSLLRSGSGSSSRSGSASGGGNTVQSSPLMTVEGIGEYWAVECLVVVSVILLVIRMLTGTSWKDDKHKK